MERSHWDSGYGSPPPYFNDLQTVAAASVAAPSASAPPVVYVFPAEWQQQVVAVCQDDVPLLETYSSHKMIAWFTVFFFGFPCGLIALLLAVMAQDRSTSPYTEERLKAAAQLGQASCNCSAAGITTGIIFILVLLTIIHG